MSPGVRMLLALSDSRRRNLKLKSSLIEWGNMETRTDSNKVGTARSGWGGERPSVLEPPRMKVLVLPPPGPLWNSK